MPSGDSTPSARNLDNRCSRSCALIIGGPSRRRFALYQKVSGTASPGPRSSRLVTLRVATKLPAPSQALACRSCHPTLFSPPAGRRMRPVKLCERGVKVPYGSMVLPGSADEKERVFGQAAARPLTTYPSARVGQAAAAAHHLPERARRASRRARSPPTRVGDRHPGVGQGALTVAARIVESVPDMDSKFYAATLAMDEARHVELYHRFIRDKIGLFTPSTPTWPSCSPTRSATPAGTCPTSACRC